MNITGGIRRLGFVILTTFIVGTSSERIFWYWSTSPVAHLWVILVYAPPVAGLLWLLARYRVRDLWGLLLAVPVFGYLVEGVITPVVYSGGPFVPFFPVWFTFWHGVLGPVVLWYFFRRWMVKGQPGRLAAGAAAMGLFWGTWAITMRLPENLEDPELIADHGGPLRLLDPWAFTGYAVTFSLILMVAHVVLGFGLWLPDFRPSRIMRWLWMAGVGATVVGWTVIIPWAGPMFVAYVGLQIVALRRYADRGRGPTVLAQLAGRTSVRAVIPMAAMPAGAALSYWAWWQADVPDDVVRYGFMWGVIAAQTLAGAILMVLSLGRAFRRTDRGGRLRSGGDADTKLSPRVQQGVE